MTAPAVSGKRIGCFTYSPMALAHAVGTSASRTWTSHGPISSLATSKRKSAKSWNQGSLRNVRKRLLAPEVMSEGMPVGSGRTRCVRRARSPGVLIEVGCLATRRGPAAGRAAHDRVDMITYVSRLLAQADTDETGPACGPVVLVALVCGPVVASLPSCGLFKPQCCAVDSLGLAHCRAW